jgi:hypothetical protein
LFSQSELSWLDDLIPELEKKDKGEDKDEEMAMLKEADLNGKTELKK